MNTENKEFEVHLLNDEGIFRARKIAIYFDDLLNFLKEIIPESRELSIVKTKLEEACFFAKKGMANQKINQKEI